MKLIIATIVALASTAAFAVPSRHECDLRDADAIHDLKLAQDRFNVGEVTRTDVDFAKIARLNEQLKCAEIIRGDAKTANSYCAQENADLMTEYMNGMNEEVQGGMRNSSDLPAARDLQIAMKVTCD